MGASHSSATGYGLIVMMDDEHDDFDEEDLSLPEGIRIEPVGDYVLGEDEGIFYMIEDADITFSTKSAKQSNGWITAYTDYQINKMPKGLRSWLKELQNKEERPTMLGFFTVETYI